MGAIERDGRNTTGNPWLEPPTATFVLLSLFDGMALRVAFGEQPSKDAVARHLRGLLADAYA